MRTSLQSALGSINNMLDSKGLYYSAIENTYFYGGSGGMGNFELRQLPQSWVGLIVEKELEPKLSTAFVTGNVQLDGQEASDLEPRYVQISKVSNAKLYGHVHDESLSSALMFAAKHHQEQVRKASGEPYINHLLEVLQLLTHFEPQCDEVTKVSAVLHDVVEDTTVTIESVELLFGVEVATVVGQLTCTASENAEDKKAKLLSQISIAGSRAKMIKLADVTSNASLIPPAWTLDRREGYLSWCAKVAETCSDCSNNLYENFIASTR
ncbi:MAG: HD domain-containing protein [Alteromonas stellipolaris]|uniref:HD domain-containing protein n=1 Tax=Alteromonas stellipolaris TaxID=233316 RepID=UPI003B8E252E